MFRRIATRGHFLLFIGCLVMTSSQVIGVDDDNQTLLLIRPINHYDDKGDFQYCEDSAYGLKNALQWSSDEESGNSVWEEEFKIASKGGKEDDYIDSSDFAYFCGQSNVQDGAQTAYFENENHDGPNLRPHEECEESYGDVEMEWIAFTVSKFMEDNGSWLAKCFGGAHLMLGWESVREDVDMGTPFGEYLVDSDDGGEDEALTIVQSWEQAADDTHSAGRNTLIIGENQAMGNDYVHDEGDGAQADPNVDGDYFRWEHETGSRTPRADVAESNSAWLVQIPARSSSGFSVSYDPTVADGLPATMPRYPVVTSPVTLPYVGSIAAAIRLTLGNDRVDGVGTPVGTDGMGNFVMSEPAGDDLFFVSPPTGAATLIDTGKWLVPPSTAPDLPSELAAVGLATDLLDALERLPVAYQTEVRRFTGSQADKATGDVIGEIGYHNIEVVFNRQLGGYPVAGPGAKILVTFGHNSYVERWSENGWRDVGPETQVPLLTWENVANTLATHGSAVTLDGITVIADTIHVNSLSVGYYEYDRWTDQPYIEPIYIADATLNSGTPSESDYTIHLHAARMPLVASISNPAEHAWFAQGSPISFEASASGGTPPYGFEWSSEIEGILGTGSSLVVPVPGLSMGQKGWSVVYHGISVTVTDSTGASRRRSIGVGICPQTWYADGDHDGFGDPSNSGNSCPPSEPVIATGGDDCDDTNEGAAIPGADEINDGLDNQCPGENGHGVADEISGDSGFHHPNDKARYSWPPQEEAGEYEVQRADDPDMSLGCVSWLTTDSFIDDSDDPLPGDAFYYLSRPTVPNLGSWGQNSTGEERIGACL